MVFDDMNLKNVVSWTVILMGFATSGRSDIYLDLFRRVVETLDKFWSCVLCLRFLKVKASSCFCA